MNESLDKLLKIARPWHIVLGVLLIYLIGVFLTSDTDTNAFVRIGSCYEQCAGISGDCPDDTEEGYDGQFVYFIARDPADAAPCIDVPAYRYQRILLPMLGRLLALGTADLLPLAFVVINLIALVGSTYLLETLLEGLNINRWFALTYGLFFGVVIAVRVSTPEPLAYGLVVLAIWFSQRDQIWGVGLALLGAAFAKETTGLFVAGFMLYYALERRWWHAVLVGALVGIPFGAWQLYLYDWLGEFGLGSGGANATSFEIIPYNGIWRMAYDEDGSLGVFLVLGILFIPSVVIPSAWGLWATIKEFRGGQYHLYTCLFFATLVVMPFVPFSTYREFLGIYRFIVGMVIMHVLYTGLRYPGRPLTYSTLWLVLLLFLPYL